MFQSDIYEADDTDLGGDMIMYQKHHGLTIICQDEKHCNDIKARC